MDSEVAVVSDITLNIDGIGQSEKITTGIPFIDHMFSLFAAHGYFDLGVTAKGDTEIDDHHTVEDLGICLGQAINQALKEKKGIRRYGESFVPMDEALARVVLDISNRPFLAYRVPLHKSTAGHFVVGRYHTKNINIGADGSTQPGADRQCCRIFVSDLCLG